jgi:hypothetical protein
VVAGFHLWGHHVKQEEGKIVPEAWGLGSESRMTGLLWDF